MDTKVFVETIRKNIHNVVKVKMFCDTPFFRWITWRLVRGNIYMYDCGENYASVRSLYDMDELFKELYTHATGNVNHVTIKYEDKSKDIYHFK